MKGLPSSCLTVLSFAVLNILLDVLLILLGVMITDEPAAPLSFLLSPTFLSTDLARISVYAVAQAVPHLPEGSLSRTLKVRLAISASRFDLNR